ncbi:MAG: TonB-dependent copper receptor [Rhodospirillaceae bacterium]|nr:TonB-dependent copper receptor [Rhodospirillaceae bacterium]MBT5751832.1 TonB-dependent copper receptor [Rhodospirillaceae bacterium]
MLIKKELPSVPCILGAGLFLNISLATLPALGDEYQVPEISIEEEASELPFTYYGYPAALENAPYSDAGDYLRSLPGVDGKRMGGHGIDPVIRGQQGNQLNVYADDSMTFGACANRMDPPSAYISPETYDRITVTKGYESVLDGGGGSGGTVKFIRDITPLDEDKPYRGRIGGGWNDAGNIRSGFFDGTAGTAETQIRAMSTVTEANHYRDGDGNKVLSAFHNHSAGGTLAFTPSEMTELSFGFDYAETTDAYFPGAGMDSPESDNKTFRVKGEHRLEGTLVQEVRANAYGSLVNHLMDNYSLRDRSSNFLRVPSTSNTFGGEIEADLGIGGQALTLAVNAQQNTRDATRYRGTTSSNVTTSNSNLWPDVGIKTTGLAAEAPLALGQDTRLIAGARYDYVHVSYGRANQTLAMAMAGINTANGLYNKYYGATAETQAEHNFGGLLRMEHDMEGGPSLFAGISRSVRTADATERGLANNMMTTSWVGNTNINPEKHNQLDLGLEWSTQAVSVSASGFVDYVDDYIFYDSARGQRGVAIIEPTTVVYTNIDALMAGGEISASVRPWGPVFLQADVSYIYGENLDDHIPLAQMPPLTATVTAEWQEETWTLGARMRGTTKQTRVDMDAGTGSGRDIQKTPGHAVLDLYANVYALDPLEVSLGVSNVLDHNYANYLNRSDVVTNTVVQVNEPGRAVYVRALARF